MIFSRRIPTDLDSSPLQAELAKFSGLLDLTATNPTRCGLAADPEALRLALASVDATRYAPEALGLLEARRSVVEHAAPVGFDVERVVMTASTSEAYALLFKLFCDPGDVIAVPAPSYPLVEVLANLEGVRLERYRLEYDGAWRLDLPSVSAALNGGAKLLIMVTPNNPTGSVPSPDERRALRRLCAERRVPLVADEVFAPYPFGNEALPTLGNDQGPLTFVLDGLSKRAGMPQLKLGWMLLYGEAGDVRAVSERLAWIADAQLSVATPVQLALPRLFEIGASVRQRILDRVRANRRALESVVATLPPVDLLAADGGWTAVLRLPQTASDDELVLHLAKTAGVRVQPGYLYDFERDGHIVIGLLNHEQEFADAVSRLRQALTTRFVDKA